MADPRDIALMLKLKAAVQGADLGNVIVAAMSLAASAIVRRHADDLIAAKATATRLGAELVEIIDTMWPSKPTNVPSQVFADEDAEPPIVVGLRH